jgi:hypothetical protein
MENVSKIMSKSRLTGIVVILTMLVVLASSCASNKTTYHSHKPRPSKCNCSNW